MEKRIKEMLDRTNGKFITDAKYNSRGVKRNRDDNLKYKCISYHITTSDMFKYLGIPRDKITSTICIVKYDKLNSILYVYSGERMSFTVTTHDQSDDYICYSCQ